MYEELIKALHCCQNKEGKPCLSCSCQQQFFCDTRHDMEAAGALESLADQLAALQSENGSKDREIERIHKELTKAHTMDTLTDYNQDFLRSKIKRVEAERDRAYRHICDQCDIFPCLEDGCPWSCGAQGEA